MVPGANAGSQGVYTETLKNYLRFQQLVASDSKYVPLLPEAIFFVLFVYFYMRDLLKRMVF